LFRSFGDEVTTLARAMRLAFRTGDFARAAKLEQRIKQPDGSEYQANKAACIGS
jgi:hypothetical protein